MFRRESEINLIKTQNQGLAGQHGHNLGKVFFNIVVILDHHSVAKRQLTRLYFADGLVKGGCVCCLAVLSLFT